VCVSELVILRMARARRDDATAPPHGDCEGRGIRESERRDRRVGHQVAE